MIVLLDAQQHLIFIATRVLTIEFIIDFKCARFFFQKKDRCFYVNILLTKISIQGSFMTDTIYKTRGSTRLYYGLGAKHMVFMALNNCSPKIFLSNSWILLSFVTFFVVQWFIDLIQRSSFFGGID